MKTLVGITLGFCELVTKNSSTMIGKRNIWVLGGGSESVLRGKNYKLPFLAHDKATGSFEIKIETEVMRIICARANVCILLRTRRLAVSFFLR